MKKHLLLLLIILSNVSSKAQNFASANKDKVVWSQELEDKKAFIENKGQFWMPQDKGIKSSILYAVDHGQSMIYFTKKGLTYHFRKVEKDKDSEREREMEREKKAKGKMSMAEYLEMEAKERRVNIITDVVNVEWINANTNPTIIAEEKTNDYNSYSINTEEGQKNINNINGYKRITYKDLYPNIDVEYIFHAVDGIKYSLIVHPGGDASQIKMKYSGTKRVRINPNGDAAIDTRFGDIIEHAPVTFYAGNNSNLIASNYSIEGKTLSFQLGDYDHSKTVVIDPWVQNPAISNSHRVWECDKDASGNVYVISGEVPMKLLKYNSAGTLQWTYSTPWDTSAGDWLGALATDRNGNSYVTNGASAALIKVNTSGGLVYSVNGGSNDEYWTIAFNCDQSKLIVGGTRLSFNTMLQIKGGGVIYDINTSNGSVTAIKNVGYVTTTTVFGFAQANPNEVRSITSSKNAKYYYLTLDSIGYIDQGFSNCNNAPPNSINSGYNFSYKAETYRPDNGNAGIKTIRANGNFVYTHNGGTIQKRSLSTLAVISSAAVPGGITTNVANTTPVAHQTNNGGLDIDSCGNVYVGSIKKIIKYDANLNVLSSITVPFDVYDVRVGYNGEVIACGSIPGASASAASTGYVQTINMSTCNPMILACCDAGFCQVGPFCSTDASVTLTPNTAGGTWSGPGVNSSGVFSPSAAGPGTHTITYTLSCGSESITIVVNACASLTVCQNTNGTLTVSGGTPTYTWEQLNPAQNTTVTNQAQCTACGGTWFFGNCTVPSCTTPASWSTMGTGTTITPSGVYPIRVTDSQGNTQTYNTQASIPACSTSCPTLTVTTASVVNVACNGGSTGSFSVSTSGGASPYDYIVKNASNVTVGTFNNIAGSQSVTGLPAGTYTITVNDNNNCPGTATVTITEPTAIVASVSSHTNATCGSSNGSATATATGGGGSYTYAWTPAGGTGANTATYSNLAAGTYTVTVTSGGCTDTAMVVINNSGTPTASITAHTDATCGSANGSATATATGGSGSYTYAWTPAGGTGANTATYSNLAAGTYTVTVTSGGCTDTAMVVINNSGAPAASITTHTDATCGASDGTATATATGGSGGYTYAWTPAGGTGANTATYSALGAGTYTVTVTSGGCTDTAMVVIGTIGGPVASISSHVNSTCGLSDGSAIASATGGAGSYTYAWTPTGGTGANTANYTNLTAGTYTVTVTSGACSDTAMVVITNSNGPTASISSHTNASCGASNGSATATATGGAGSYTYAWTPAGGTGANTANYTNLAAGTYTVTVTSGACSDTAMVIITNSTNPNASISTQNNATCGASNGSATATATGGTGTYTYAWTPSGGTGANTATYSNLGAGTYTVTVTSGGCTDTAMVTITNTIAPTATITNQVNATCGLSNGSATAAASGGNGTYTYAWTPAGGTGANTANYTNLSAGTYTVTVTSGSCTDTAMVVLSGSANLTVNISGSNSICSGSSTTLTANAPGATTYSWNTTPVQTTQSITVSPTTLTTYTVNVSDGTCSGTATITVAVATPFVAAISGDTTICLGQQTTLTATSGTSYLWSPGGETTQSITVSPTSTITYTVIAGNSNPAPCNVDTASVTVHVGGGGGNGVNAGPDQTITIGQSATLTATNGGSVYAWNTGENGATIVVTPRETTVYWVTSTDGSGCGATDSVTVFVDIKCGEIYIPTAFSPNDDGMNDLQCVFGNCITTMYWAVYDRWGEKVYETVDQKLCWDGTYRGKALNTGVFVYKLEATLLTGETIIKKGNFTITK